MCIRKTNNSIFTTVLSLVMLCSTALHAGRNPGKDFDLQRFIDLEIAAGNKTVTIPPGVYRVKPHNREHLNFSNLDGVTIIAQGVEMVCTETTRAITIDHCKNFSIVGLTIDYDPLCYTQGRITRLSEDKKIIEFRLDDGYPDNLVERIEIFDSETLTLKRSTYYGWEPFMKTGARTYTVSKGKHYRYNPALDCEEVGDILVTNNDYTPGGNVPHAIYSDYCENLRLEDITLYSGNCFGFFETNGTKNQYIRCRIDRRSQETDHYERAKRIRSNDADAFHSKFAFVGPQLMGCVAKFQGDDGINICGEYYFSVGGQGREVRLVVTHGCRLQAGSEIEILTFEGKKIHALVRSVEEAGVISQEQIAGIMPLEQNAGQKRALTRPTNRIVKLTLDRSVDFGFGAVVGDRNRVGNGFLIQDCNFSFNRSRGILIKGSSGKIIGNVLEENWMPSILISPEVWWLESGAADEVEVRDNAFIRNKNRHVVNVTGEGFDHHVPEAGLHKHIIIDNNTFVGCVAPCIYVGSTDGLSVRSNTFLLPVRTDDIQLCLFSNCKKVKTDL